MTLDGIPVRVTTDLRDYGHAVRLWRLSEGLSLRDLASLLDISAVMLANCERGLFPLSPSSENDLTDLGFQSPEGWP